MARNVPSRASTKPLPCSRKIPKYFENTIAYNLTLDLPFPSADVEAACAASHFSEVVAELPRGLDSNIQEKGVNLSGGQKQRLALARGILAAAESDVVLLDEPTSSVDPKTEALIYQRLFEAFSGKAMDFLPPLVCTCPALLSITSMF